MLNKKVSVILPCYNVEKYLRANLESILKQTYKNFEIVAVNDGSTDKTGEILEEYNRKVPFMKVITQKNGGLSAARNTGIDNSDGEYISYVDSDDILTEDYLETLVNNLEKYDADISICNFRRVKEGKKLKAKAKHKIHEFHGINCVKELFRQKTFDICVWNKLYKRSLMGDLHFNNEVRYAEDIAYNYMYFKKCKKAVFDEKVCYFYIRRSTGLVKSPLSKNKLSSFKDVDIMCEDSEKNSPELIPYTHAWKSLVSLEFLYYVYKSNYDDKEVTKKLLSNMKNNMPYLKQANRMILFRRTFTPLGYFLAKILLRKKIK